MCTDLATVSLCTSQHLGALQKYPADQNQLVHVDIPMFFFITTDHPFFVSLSIHFDIVPLWMVLDLSI